MIVLVIPVAAFLCALVWVRWARKPDKPLDDISQVEDYRRRLDALAPDATAARRTPDQRQAPRRRMPSLH